MKRSFAVLLSALTCAAAASPSFAAVITSAAFTNLQYELIDLTPDDDIAASVSFDFTDPRLNRATVQVSLYERATHAYLNPLDTSAPFGELSLDEHYTNDTSNPNNALHAHASTGGTLATGFNVRTEAGGSGAGAFAQATASPGTVTFVLSANSALRLTGEMYVGASIGSGTRSDYTTSQAGLEIYRDQSEFGSAQIIAQWERYTLGQDATGYLTRPIDHLIQNGSDRATKNQLWVSAYSSADVTAVPEPATCGMLLTSMAILLGGRRRRKA